MSTETRKYKMQYRNIICPYIFHSPEYNSVLSMALRQLTACLYLYSKIFNPAFGHQVIPYRLIHNRSGESCIYVVINRGVHGYYTILFGNDCSIVKYI